MLRSPLQILMLAPTPFFSDRGCHVRIFEEAKALRTLGHEVVIVTYHLGRDVGQIPTWRIPRIPWYRKQTAGPSWHKPYLDVLLFFKALQVRRRFRPHVIHAHLHEGAFIGCFLKKILKVPLVFDCQGSLTAELVDHGFCRKGSLLFRFFHALERHINRWPDHIITSSTPTAELLESEFGLNADRVTAVVDGVDTEVFRPRPDTGSLRDKLCLPTDKRIVVFLGAMTAYQGMDLLLESVKLIQQRTKKVHFLLMGYPSGEYEKKARRLGVAESITFTGKIAYDRAAEFLSLGDLAVSPKLARTEANGKLFNYMACGLPVVVFDTPVNREIMGDLGVYAAYDDPGGFADKILWALDDPERLGVRGRMLRKKAEQEHSWEARGNRLAEIYRLLKG